MESFFSMKANKVLGSLALFMVIVALASYSQYVMKQAEYLNMGPATISITGEGEVTAVPDIGEFNFSVATHGKDATTAQEESATKINAILAYLGENEVEKEDVKTENYNLRPKYRYEQKICEAGQFCPREQVQDGFDVNQTVRVKVRDVDNSGTLIAGVGDLGATNISSLQFTIDDTDVLKEKARELAIAEAKEKAQILANDLGVRLVRIVSYHENSGGQPYPYGMGGDVMMAKAESSFDQAPSLPTGENVIKSTVNITYQVR